MRDTRSFLTLFALLIAAVAIQFFLPGGEPVQTSTTQTQGLVENEEYSDQDSTPRAALDPDKVPGPGLETPVSIDVVAHEAGKVSSGVTLLPLSGAEQIVIINNAGEILHSWNLDAQRARLLPNGNLLVLHGSQWGKNQAAWKAHAEVVREYTWDGKLAWEFQSSSRVHHDVARLENGNTLFLNRAVVNVPPPQDPELIEQLGSLPRRIRSDRIIEVGPEKEIVWSWKAHEHLDVYDCGARKCGGMHERKAVRGQLIDWTHTNTLTVIPKNRWFRGGDERFRPGNLVILPRNFWQVLVIDRETKQITWRYPAGKTFVPLQKDELVRGHEAHMIEEPLPGAGNFLVFDNGLDGVREYSIIREINPITSKTVWRYEDHKNFFGRAGGSLQRMPNGNTVVSQDRGDGRVFEIDADGAIVWDVALSHEPARANKYPYDFCPQLSAFNNS